MTIRTVAVACFAAWIAWFPGKHDIDLELDELCREGLEPGRLSVGGSVPKATSRG
jgi:hypothetical protein